MFVPKRSMLSDRDSFGNTAMIQDPTFKAAPLQVSKQSVRLCFWGSAS